MGNSRRATYEPEDEIVISGIAGRFPGSKNIVEFEYNLYNKVDMVDDRELRWRHDNVEIPKRSGKVHDLSKFDATFFGVHFKQAHCMDPQTRLLVEHAYEAVLDAGINPKQLKGRKTGVFIGACFTESEKTWFYETVTNNGFGITGCSRAMMANRISYTLGLTGPSFLTDSACSSSMYALDCAYSAIRNGDCDSAIVGGANLLLHPYLTLQFARLGVLASDGICRPFDEAACGYTRAEAISAIFIQKRPEAKRIYASLLFSKTNCDGYKEEGITFPSRKMQAELLTEFYHEINIDPTTVDYVEAHSTGTVVGDPEECYALDSVFCKNRTKPLLVGSVKSNVGHAEAAAGMCAIAKCLLALDNQVIPPNANFTKPRPTIPSLVENRLAVVHESTPMDGQLIGISSFGFGGANAHALLKGFDKQKINNGAPSDDIPRLIKWSGRTEEACNTLLDFVGDNPLDAEYVGLLHSTLAEPINGHVFRGYGLFAHVEGENAKCISREVQHFTGLKRPIVYVFSGMGSQWAEMGTSLMELPIFMESIQKCHNALKPKGISLIDIITSPDKKSFDNILNSFVGIASIQIAICDVLKSLNLKPDLIIGHSVGELGCAYADECLTLEQMVLCAYSRGLASIETKKIRGSMAAIGLGYRKICNLLPSTIDVACHNSADSCTISGPQEEVEKFVSKLSEQGVFAREVPCSNIAYHSRYISDMGPTLFGYLSKIIKVPKKRSEKWLSSSAPKNKWDQVENQYCSAEYQTNNLLNSVLFEETAMLLPANSLTIEIAPHGLLQAIIRKSMPNALHIPLTQRGNKENLNYFLTALGKLYLNGIDLPMEQLYPKVEFPVSRGTKKISHLIKWDHSEDWYVMKFEIKKNESGETRVKLSLQHQEYEYASGHIIDGRCLFPATAYLHLVWDSYSKMRGVIFSCMDIQFENVQFLRATTFSADTEVEFIVMIQSGTGRFEITEGSAPVVTGYIKELEGNEIKFIDMPPVPESDYPYLATRDFYKELKLRGYHYQGAFRSVLSARSDGLWGKVKWDHNWVSFMDCMLQISIIGNDTRSLLIPTRIEKLTINTNKHYSFINNFDPENPDTHYFDINCNRELQVTQAGGIEIKGLHANPVVRRKPPGIPVLESYKFISHIPTPSLSIINVARFCVQFCLENNQMFKIKVIEVLEKDIKPIIGEFKEALGDMPLVTADLLLLTMKDIKYDYVQIDNSKISQHNDCMFIIQSNCLEQHNFFETVERSLNETGFIVSREAGDLDINNINVPTEFNLIAVIPSGDENFVLLRKIKRKIPKHPVVVKISSADTEYAWLEKLRHAIKNGAVIVYTENESLSGIIGLANCIRKEPDGSAITCFFIDDKNAPPFDIENPFYKSQIQLEWDINVYRNGKWGTYRHLMLEVESYFGPTKLHAVANIGTRGDLSTLKWMNGPYNNCRISKTNLMQIQYASLNFRDVMLATGKLSIETAGSGRLEQEHYLGFEYSGVNQNGKRMMGMGKFGSLSTHLNPDSILTWDCPDKWTLEQAATVPVVYGTVYASLFVTTKIQKGKSILIHAGTGGVGLAAIQVCFAYGLDVFTTCSTAEKKQFLLNRFPTLKENQIGNSRDISFERMVMVNTNGRGVDYVLNSLAGEKLQASLRCLGQGGKFLEIGKFDLSNDTQIGLGIFLKELTFHSILVDNLFKATQEKKMALKSLISKDIESGIIQPLPSTCYTANDLEGAFRYLASGKHIGKVLVQLRDDPYDMYTIPMNISPRVNCDSTMSYIIPGGLGGFGLELADWLIIRGARKLVLSSTRGVTKPYQEYRLRMWKSYGATVVINTSNIATEEGAECLIKEAIKLGPVGGIFNLAVVLVDSIFENQTMEKFTKCLAPKADATKYLDKVSRKLCPDLRFFVIFSSVSCGRGNAGQSNYGMANSIMERIIEQRHKDNLPAKAIQWGAVGEVGLVADMAESKIDMEIGGTLQQRISSCLEELDNLLCGTDPIVASMVVAEKRSGVGGRDSIVETVMNIMSIRDIKSVSMDATLSELGMDSLMAVEIKQSLEREFELFLTAQDLRALTFGKLTELADAKKPGENLKLSIVGNEGIVGIHMLIRSLGEEANSSIPVYRFNTKDNSPTYKSALFVIPGVEGVAGSIWHTIAAALTMPSFCLQLTDTNELSTINDISNFVFKNLQINVLKNIDNFSIAGYSFGAYIALELAYILESAGYTGNVVLIDGAPDFLKKLGLGQLNTNVLNDDAIQVLTVCHIIRVIYPAEDPEDLQEKIAEIPTWELRVGKLLELAQNQNIYSAEYLKQIAFGIYNRISVALRVNTDEVKKLKSSITLIRPTEVSVFDVDEDYGLQNYTHSNVTLKFIEGNHITMLENPKLPLLLNEFCASTDTDTDFAKLIKTNK